MFTGIIEKKGIIHDIKIKHDMNNHIDGCYLRISEPSIQKAVKLGDSLAVNGVCLTIVDITDKYVEVDVMNETLNKTTIGSLKPNDEVNLEKALTLQDPLGGHLVLGHVDGLGKIISITEDGISKVFRFTTNSEILNLIAYKACIAIDGISLTVSALGEDYFEISAIPFTLQETVLGNKQVNDMVNLENDCMARYIFRYEQVKQGA
ncbi:riboflavin synthase [Ureaplasma ceti]|uniref:Riboflavin synthase n=1 Tax=Ureaplasma ceti TaxID=3119530 RepID=A0ABP9U6A7_9BACT